MTALTTALLARAIYDLFVKGLSFTKDGIKNKLTEFITNDEHAEILAQKLEKLGLNEDMSEKAIEKELNNQPDIVEILKNIPETSKSTINQTHFGSGDNVGGNKIINPGK
ncbi:GapS6a family protein [Rahnella sp. EDr1-12]|uniref:GapS6a family protein n=1 Tax=unclassified Rahnella TaxID=2635087 RepID=UPI003BAD0957